MSEKEKVEKQQEDNRPPVTDDGERSIEDNSLLSGENKAVSEEKNELSTPHLQPDNETMEVQKHPHQVTHKKKRGEYLLEFFILFIAVFFGFRKQIPSLIFLILFTLLIPQIFNGQEPRKINVQNKPSPQNKLVGTWKLISYADFDSATNKWVQPYGEHPQGYFTYTSTNVVNLNISHQNSLKLTEDSAKTKSISYYNLIENYSFGYFGTYSVDWEKTIVTHHVKGGSVFWYNDTNQPRPFILKGDTLIIGNLRIKKRVLVRAD